MASAPPPPKATPVLLPMATEIATAAEIALIVAADSAVMAILLPVEEATEFLI